MNMFLSCYISCTKLHSWKMQPVLQAAETREKVHKRALVAVEIYHRLSRDERNVERASARALSARSRKGCANGAHEISERENGVTARSRDARRVLARSGEGGQGRLITVAFCGFVARHDPRAFRGPHCSPPNRSGNGCRTVVRRGRVPVVRKTVPARADPRLAHAHFTESLYPPAESVSGLTLCQRSLEKTKLICIYLLSFVYIADRIIII